jgi:2-polyprenyl-6-methoxyphenol hydroxylase-like FAD-dependent oxidoreductase
MSDEFDVVVVGGGPVGLWLAAELALADVKVTVLERRLERVSQSRALAIQGRTLEMFALRGLADRFISRGRQVPNMHFGGLETRLDFSVFDTRFPFVLLLPQATTEAILEQRAVELGVEIKRGHVVETVIPRADGVVVEGRNEDGAFRVFARYVVGADGARSIVRGAAGIDFIGHPARRTMMLGDVVLDEPPARPMVPIVNQAGALIVVTLGDGIHHRLVVVDAPITEVAASTPVSLSGLAAAAARVAGMDFRPRDPIWLSRFTDETRLAEHYRKGRVLLAGDAAHIHAPMGGQGMNVGIQDAMNLGWKLASVVHGTAPEALLDSYERERWPVGEALLRNTLAQLVLFTNFDPPTLALRRTFEDILGVAEVNRQLADETSGFGVAYPEALCPPDAGWEHRKGVSGQRLAETDLVLADGSTAKLYDFFTNGRWVRLQRAPDVDTRANKRPINVVNLAPRHDKSMVNGVVGGFAAMLVRPDGYVGAVFPGAE